NSQRGEGCRSRRSQDAVTLSFRVAFVCLVAAILCGLLSPICASAKELFRYRVLTKDGPQLEYVFESSTEPSPSSITREKATEIAANWMTMFYNLQLGSIESVKFYEKPLPHWLVCLADTASGPSVNLLFAVVLPDGKIVEPSMSGGIALPKST